MSKIQLYNTLTRQKEIFVPIEPGKVKMYTCGPTVYDFAHIGNFRAFIFEDLLKRWLEHRGYKIVHVMNITDVDDKTIRGSRSRGIPFKKYTDFYSNAFFEDAKTLNIEPADKYPRATEHIPEMVNLIKTLMTKGYAYRGEDCSIYFAIRKFPDYGKLSGVKVGELKSGARVNVDEYAKEEAQDFALWKAWTPEDGDVFWDTEIGKGRPGWHIECSAMSMKYLGTTFDIHCGGVDNMFPHHENEIAQSEAATGEPFVHAWMHNEHLLVEGRKMAKSFGNYYTLRDLLTKGCDPMAIRYLLLSTHYRQQFNFTFEGLDGAKGAIERLANVMRRLQEAKAPNNDGKITELVERAERCFGEAMDDDLNISLALASLFDFVREINQFLDANAVTKIQAERVLTFLYNIDKVLGVVGNITKQEVLPEEAANMIAKREKARLAKDWKTADEIRQQLLAMGVTVEDTAQGVRWRLKKN